MSWIKLHRSLLDHAWLRKRPEWFMAWVEILMLTNHKTARVEVGLARRRMRHHFTNAAWRHFVARLQAEGMLRVETVENLGSSRGVRTVGIVVNWRRFQGMYSNTANDTASNTANDTANDTAKPRQERRNAGSATPPATPPTTPRITPRMTPNTRSSSFQSTTTTELTTNHNTGDGRFLKEIKALLPNASTPELEAKRTELERQADKRGEGHVSAALRITLNRFPPPARPWAYLLATLSTPNNLEQPNTAISSISGGTPQPVRGQNRDFLDKRAELERQAEQLMQQRRDVN